MTADAVRAEQIRTLYSQSSSVLLANLLIAAMVGATLWSHAPHPVIVGWVGLLALMTLLRGGLRARYIRVRPTPSESGPWGTRFVAGSIAAGILWGLAAVMFFDPRGVLGQVLLPLAIGGMCAGAAGTLSCYMPAFQGFLVPALLPLVLRTLVLGDSLHVAIGSMLVLFGLLLELVAHNTHRAITGAFRLRFENDALLERLSISQRSLEETNLTLEQRVLDRTAALERQGDALREAQRLESVGRLAAGIAHDFNNLLTVVLANVTLMLREQPLDEPTRTALEEVEQAAVRGADLVRQLLAFGRRQRLAPRVVNLNDVVLDLQRILARLIDAQVQLTVTTAPGQALVKADRGQLEQVIINLVTNARNAMPSGGSLTIETAVVDTEGDPILPAGPHVVLAVRDTGVGMDPETRRRVFEPFFTTREFGQGTGLGLATVYGVVEQSGGRVRVESVQGAGSTFKVYLPRCFEAETTMEPPTPAAPEIARATILLAEDSAEVRGRSSDC